MQPLATLLGDYIRRSGQQWSTTAMAKLAVSLANGDLPTSSTAFREHLRQESEETFFHSLRVLLASTQWRFLPDDSKTLCFEETCFRTSSRTAATVYELLVHPTARCPHQLLRLVDNPTVEAATTIQNTCQDCMDDFTRDHLKAFPAPLDGVAGLPGDDHPHDHARHRWDRVGARPGASAHKQVGRADARACS